MAVRPETHALLLRFEKALPELVEGMAAVARVLAGAVARAAKALDAFGIAAREDAKSEPSGTS